MDKTTAIASLTSGTIFSIGVVVAIVCCIARRSAEGARWCRFWSVIPHGIYGGFAIQASFHPRYDRDGVQSKLGAIFVSQGIHGITGILLLPWALAVMALCKWLKNTTSWPHTLKWGGKQRRSGFFYILVIDMSFLACIAVAMAYGTVFTPWSFDNCSDYEAYDTWPRPRTSSKDFQDQCRRGTTIQVLAAINFAVLASNSLLILPLIAMPSAIRAQIFFISRALTLRRNKPKQRHHWHGAEKIPLREKNELDAPELEDIIRSDSIVRILYSHLHVDDVSNISQTSKAMRVAVLTNTSEGGAERREMICENACENKKKGECWGCQKVICRGCRTMRAEVPTPRTMDHLQSCFALCTRCYIQKPEAIPAPLLATWDPHNLSRQHLNCAADPKTLQTAKKELQVDVCRSCAKLRVQDLQVLRETRDEIAIRATLAGRVRCFRCENALTGRKKRWWVCGLGPHECHWAGHEAAKKRS